MYTHACRAFSDISDCTVYMYMEFTLFILQFDKIQVLLEHATETYHTDEDEYDVDLLF